VLSTLAQYDAPATFFVIGKNIPGNESILKQIDAEGHSIGNHSYTHSFYVDFKSLRGFKNELNQTAECVFKVIGKRTHEIIQTALWRNHAPSCKSFKRIIGLQPHRLVHPLARHIK
jgi:peptidoglycan/xylan/chitin deacetylase (PgdA/CDA1 family)